LLLLFIFRRYFGS
jgi:hypothetical protein